MPAMCGAAMEVPLMVLNVPMSSGPGPFLGASPVEQIGRYGRQEGAMSSPGAGGAGPGGGAARRSPRGVVADLAIAGARRLVVVRGDREDAAGRVLAGR